MMEEVDGGIRFYRESNIIETSKGIFLKTFER